jgi:hypothetical protein
MNDQQFVLIEKSLSVGSQHTAFLIRCMESEAGTIRSHAKHERRSISWCAGPEGWDSSRSKEIDRRNTRASGTRTALLIRCSILEADQIRIAARRKEMSINLFALDCLRRSWNVDQTSGATHCVRIGSRLLCRLARCTTQRLAECLHAAHTVVDTVTNSSGRRTSNRVN